METKNDVLLENKARIVYFSDRRLVIVNTDNGDVFIFSRDGKIISHFNHKGKSGNKYSAIQNLIYDEINGEIIITDFYLKKFLVYTLDGKYKRTIQLPKNTKLDATVNYNDDSLLTFDVYQLDDPQKLNTVNQKPYLLISKKMVI